MRVPSFLDRSELQCLVLGHAKEPSLLPAAAVCLLATVAGVWMWFILQRFEMKAKNHPVNSLCVRALGGGSTALTLVPSEGYGGAQFLHFGWGWGVWPEGCWCPDSPRPSCTPWGWGCCHLLCQGLWGRQRMEQRNRHCFPAPLNSGEAELCHGELHPSPGRCPRHPSLPGQQSAARSSCGRAILLKPLFVSAFISQVIFPRI